jgi:uncharacterized membrane protein
MEILALFLEMAGTLCIAYAALSVHHKVLNEHKIDNKVVTSMRREQVVAQIGVALIIVAFILQATNYFSNRL